MSTDVPLVTFDESTLDSVDWGLDVAFAASLLVHGFVDVVVTMAAWEMEQNGIVLLLGPRRWAFAKIVSISLAAVVWYFTRHGVFGRDSTMFFLGIWTGLGVTVTVMNAYSLGWL